MIKRKNKTTKLTKKPITARSGKKQASKKPAGTAVLIKSEENPIISPSSENGWEVWQTFNPGVILLEDPKGFHHRTSRIHFLYRAIGKDGISRLGYAVSNNGFIINERLSSPVYEHKPIKLSKEFSSFLQDRSVFIYHSFASGGSFGGSEDPRPVRVDEEDTIYMTYTACDEGLRVALTSIKVQDFLQKKWKWRAPKLISPPNEVHKNWVLFPEKIKGKYALLTSINPEVLIEYLDDLEFNDGKFIKSSYGGICRKNCWDTQVRGAGPPPIKTKYGWLLFYHATDKSDPGKYKVGAMLLDLNDPKKILHRSPEPILEPTEVYENNGFKGGVVYASGAVVKDTKLLVYYGAADSYVGIAYADFNKFIKEFVKGVKLKLERKPLKKNKMV